MATLKFSLLSKNAQRIVYTAMVSGASLAVGGAAVAIYNAVKGSTNMTSIVAACCGAGMFLQSVVTVHRCTRKMEELSPEILQKMVITMNSLSIALFREPLTPSPNIDINTVRTLLRDLMEKLDVTLSEACFWNEIENFSRRFGKEKMYFAKMDRELFHKLKDLLNADQSIVGESLIIEETDIFEKITNLLLAHEVRCRRGLAGLEQEYEENLNLVAYLENNEPNIDVNKESPIREINPADNRGAFYPKSPKVSLPKVSKAPEMDVSPSSVMYPDSPRASSRKEYYKIPRKYETPKKSKKSPKHSGDTPRGETEKSPKHSGDTPRGETEKSPKHSGDTQRGETEKSPKHSGDTQRGETEKSPKHSGDTQRGETEKSPKHSGDTQRGETKKSPKRSADTPKEESEKSPKHSGAIPKETPKKSVKQSGTPKKSPKSPKPQKSPKKSPKSPRCASS